MLKAIDSHNSNHTLLQSLLGQDLLDPVMWCVCMCG
jgi:hypothetical protein